VDSSALSNTYSSTQQQDILASTHPARKTNPRTSGVLRTPKSKRFQTFEHGESPDNQFQMSASTDAWQTLSKEVDGPDGEPFYTCLGVKKDGVDCHYWAGKQAMKRHVEATHLGIKSVFCICTANFLTIDFLHRRHSCSYCTKAFSQVRVKSCDDVPGFLNPSKLRKLRCRSMRQHSKFNSLYKPRSDRPNCIQHEC
jgi:hypothetical protein